MLLPSTPAPRLKATDYGPDMLADSGLGLRKIGRRLRRGVRKVGRAVGRILPFAAAIAVPAAAPAAAAIIRARAERRAQQQTAAQQRELLDRGVIPEGMTPMPEPQVFRDDPMRPVAEQPVWHAAPVARPRVPAARQIVRPGSPPFAVDPDGAPAAVPVPGLPAWVLPVGIGAALLLVLPMIRKG